MTLCMRGHLNRENREVLLASILMPASCATASMERSENVSDGKSDMNANRNSDDFVVPSTRGNKAGTPVADRVEERRSPKGSAVVLLELRTLSRIKHSICDPTATTSNGIAAIV